MLVVEVWHSLLDKPFWKARPTTERVLGQVAHFLGNLFSTNAMIRLSKIPRMTRRVVMRKMNPMYESVCFPLMGSYLFGSERKMQSQSLTWANIVLAV